MDAGENARANNCEKRHRLCRAIDRCAPLLTREEKDRGDEGSGMADTDPEDEVRDVPCPAVRVVFTPNAHPIRNLVSDAKEPEQCDGRERDK